jgi:hypothetical protein
MLRVALSVPEDLQKEPHCNDYQKHTLGDSPFEGGPRGMFFPV